MILFLKTYQVAATINITYMKSIIRIQLSFSPQFIKRLRTIPFHILSFRLFPIPYLYGEFFIYF